MERVGFKEIALSALVVLGAITAAETDPRSIELVPNPDSTQSVCFTHPDRPNVWYKREDCGTNLLELSRRYYTNEVSGLTLDIKENILGIPNV